MARRLPPLNALRTFEAAARHVSFLHAAEELNVTPATGDDVDRVIVDGRTIVDAGGVLTLDVPAAVQRLNDASERVWARLDL